MAKKTPTTPPTTPEPTPTDAPAEAATAGVENAAPLDHTTGVPPATASDANAGAAPVESSFPPSPPLPPTIDHAGEAELDREAQILAKLTKIGDPYAKRQEVNAEIIALREEMHELRRSYEATLRQLEDKHRQLDEEARWTAEDKRLLELELAKLKKARASMDANLAAEEEAKKIRAQVEADLKRAGVAV